jgi:hypothetical protein
MNTDDNNNDELKKIDFGTYIQFCINKFQKIDGDKYFETEYAKRLEEAMAFLFTDGANRNPQQVSNEIWKILLHNHLNHFNYN